MAKVADGGASPTTANRYRRMLHAFYGWLAQAGRWPSNPVDAVPTVKTTDKTFDRRALAREELARLLEAAPFERSVCYLTAATTGLRRSELSAFEWPWVDLAAATLTVRASTAKDRREAVLPLAPETVTALRAWRDRQAAAGKGKVFDRVPTIKRFKRDLAAAGLEYETEMGRADFHALRGTFATSLARSGAPLVLAQKLMRHSTPSLTANVYTRLELHDGAAAVARLGTPSHDPESSCGASWGATVRKRGPGGSGLPTARTTADGGWATGRGDWIRTSDFQLPKIQRACRALSRSGA